ncbi:MAG: hypothetical protein ACOWWH_08540 [Eubacteriaceae bacterium]
MMKKIFILHLMILLLLCGCNNTDNTKFSNSNQNNNYYSNHLFSGGNLEGGFEIREIKVQKILNEEKIVLNFFSYSPDSDGVKANGVPIYDFNFDDNKAKLSFRNEVKIKTSKPNTKNSDLINNISIQPTYDGQSTTINFSFVEYTEYKIEENLDKGQLILYVKIKN